MVTRGLSGFFGRLLRYRSSSNRYISSSSRLSSDDGTKLSQPLPGLPQMVYTDTAKQKGVTQVTKLDNGLTVASENKFGQFVTVGVVTRSGPRFESGFQRGVSHFLEKLAFGSTVSYDNRDAIMQVLERHGGICDCQVSKDIHVQAVSANHAGLPEVMDILSDTSLRPLITPEEVEDVKQAILFELDMLNMQPNPEPVLMDLIHQGAFRDNTLGIPKLCTPSSADTMSPSALYSYLATYHNPSNMVVAGVGMEHDELVALAQETFVRKQPIWETEMRHLVADKLSADYSLSQYTGGEAKIMKDMSGLNLGEDPLPELAHVVIGLESCSYLHPDFVPSCVLNIMMGGGGSFSAGGPGKGMYTRLYLNVLNRNSWIFNATAYNHAYEDGGVFCVHAGSSPGEVDKLVDVISREMINMAGPVAKEELHRAKTQLKSLLLMNLESRPVAFEDIGRQVLSEGQRKSTTHYCDLIDAVTEEDVRRVASDMLQSKVSVAALGDLQRMPSYSSVQESMHAQESRFSKFSFFK